MTVGIEEIVAQVSAWRGRELEIEPLAGGLTNTNYRATVDGEPFFVRVPGAETGLLAVDRQNELHNTRAAAATGIGARVVAALPDRGVIVLEWIDGQTMSNAVFDGEGWPERVAASLHRLHGAARFLHDFDMFRLTERYLRVVDERDIPIPEGYRDRLPLVSTIEAALASMPVPSVPCHNDLLAENYLDDGRRLRIVDYEYSGNNDPSFELGNTCQELGWDDRRIEALCAAYFGAATPARLARMRLNMIMSDVGWTLWAAIQARISTIDYDFWGWAVERWERAAAKLDSAALEDWIRDIRADDGPAGVAARA
jgi:thiamine kinase-like enzyme